MMKYKVVSDETTQVKRSLFRDINAKKGFFLAKVQDLVNVFSGSDDKIQSHPGVREYILAQLGAQVDKEAEKYRANAIAADTYAEKHQTSAKIEPQQPSLVAGHVPLLYRLFSKPTKADRANALKAVHPNDIRELVELMKPISASEALLALARVPARDHRGNSFVEAKEKMFNFLFLKLPKDFAAKDEQAYFELASSVLSLVSPVRFADYLQLIAEFPLTKDSLQKLAEIAVTRAWNGQLEVYQILKGLDLDMNKLVEKMLEHSSMFDIPDILTTHKESGFDISAELLALAYKKGDVNVDKQLDGVVLNMNLAIPDFRAEAVLQGVASKDTITFLAHKVGLERLTPALLRAAEKNVNSHSNHYMDFANFLKATASIDDSLRQELLMKMRERVKLYFVDRIKPNDILEIEEPSSSK